MLRTDPVAVTTTTTTSSSIGCLPFFETLCAGGRESFFFGIPWWYLASDATECAMLMFMVLYSVVVATCRVVRTRSINNRNLCRQSKTRSRSRSESSSLVWERFRFARSWASMIDSSSKLVFLFCVRHEVCFVST